MQGESRRLSGRNKRKATGVSTPAGKRAANAAAHHRAKSRRLLADHRLTRNRPPPALGSGATPQGLCIGLWPPRPHRRAPHPVRRGAGAPAQTAQPLGRAVSCSDYATDQANDRRLPQSAPHAGKVQACSAINETVVVTDSPAASESPPPSAPASPPAAEASPPSAPPSTRPTDSPPHSSPAAPRPQDNNASAPR